MKDYLVVYRYMSNGVQAVGNAVYGDIALPKTLGALTKKIANDCGLDNVIITNIHRIDDIFESYRSNEEIEEDDEADEDYDPRETEYHDPIGGFELLLDRGFD
ncbi:hypothetical protein FACS1894110_10150 [Spirochaetia bacterium]|nr:hypothetical protein FACS1894110_10150 [Spirochaetia bacterium]